MVSSVKAWPFSLGDNEVKEIKSEYKLFLEAEYFEYDEAFETNIVQTPEFLEEKRIPAGQDFLGYVVNDICQEIIRKCQNAEAHNILDELSVYTDDWKDTSGDAFEVRRIYSGSVISDSIRDILASSGLNEDHLEKTLCQVLPSIYVGSKTDINYLAFSNCVQSSKAYLKPEDYVGSSIVLAEYNEGNGLLIGMAEEGDYVSVYAQPVRWDDISSIDEYMGAIFSSVNP